MDQHERREGFCFIYLFYGLSWCLRMLVQHALDMQTLRRVETIWSWSLTSKGPNFIHKEAYIVHFLGSSASQERERKKNLRSPPETDVN